MGASRESRESEIVKVFGTYGDESIIRSYMADLIMMDPEDRLDDSKVMAYVKRIFMISRPGFSPKHFTH